MRRACLSALLAGMVVVSSHSIAGAPAAQASQASGPGAQARAQAEAEDATLTRARSLLQNGQVREAELSVRQFLKEHPSSAGAHFLLGYVLFRKIQADASAMMDAAASDNAVRLPSIEENLKESLAEFTEGAKFHAPGAFDLKIVALDYILLKDYADADKWLTKSLLWDAKDSEAWYYLGRTKYNENRFEEAVSAFQQCLKLDEKNVKAEDNLGLAYQGLGRNDGATTAFKKAISWQKDTLNQNSGPFIDLGALLLEQNRAQEAVEYLVQGAAISPREARAHEHLGKAYERLEQLDKAQAEFEKAVGLSPQSASLHYLLGRVYRKQGNVDKAKIEFDRSAELRGNTSGGDPDR